MGHLRDKARMRVGRGSRAKRVPAAKRAFPEGARSRSDRDRWRAPRAIASARYRGNWTCGAVAAPAAASNVSLRSAPITLAVIAWGKRRMYVL